MNQNMSGLAALVHNIGNDSFNQQFYHFARDQWQADQCTIFRLHDNAPPQCLLVEAEQGKTRKVIRELVQEYTDGAYHRDPNLYALRQGNYSDGQSLVNCVSPSQVSDLAYRRRFYESTSAGQELALITEQNGQRFYISFVRSRQMPQRQVFSNDEAGQLQQMSSLLAQILGKHTHVMGPRLQAETACQSAAVLTRERREYIRQQLHETLLKAPGKLTPREAQICALIAIGHTSLGISLTLGVSVNTVGTHRKRAYAKLKISSQSELFSRYVDSAGMHD